MSSAARTRRSDSEPPPYRRGRGHSMYNDMRTRNPMMFMMPNPRAVSGRFVKCEVNDCTHHSGVAEFPSMTLRCGMKRCLEHMTITNVDVRAAYRPNLDKMTMIFYDLELSRDGEIEQIGATVLDDNTATFSAMVRTNIRTNTSPILKAIPPTYWNMFACEPAEAINNFVGWIKHTHAMRTGGDSNPENIMLAAHNGCIHDHIKLVRMMMINGIEPPNYRLIDTLVMFKLLKGVGTRASLMWLRDTYAPWIDHVPHDADSDAAVLKYVVTIAYPNTKWTCYPFGISCIEYIDRTGMNMYLPSTIVTIPASNTLTYPYMAPYYDIDDENEVRSGIYNSGNNADWDRFL